MRNAKLIIEKYNWIEMVSCAELTTKMRNVWKWNADITKCECETDKDILLGINNTIILLKI